jgi:hypothetical protein
MENLLGKHLFINLNLSFPENGIYRVMRRINRETKTQYISDAQRFLYVKEKGKDNWDKKPIFHGTSKRYRKKKMFDKQGNLIDKYKIVDSTDYSAMISDIPFNELFKIVKGDGNDYLSKHDLKTFNKKVGLSLLPKIPFRKTNKDGYILQDVCIDTKSYVANHLKEVFGVDVYVVDRMWCDKRFIGKQYCGHNYSFKYSRECDFDRNAVFYQETSFGGDKSIISKEEDEHNSPVFLWFFKDKIVYKKNSSRSEH